MAEIDSTAIVSTNAVLAPDVVVGAYALIGANVTIGSGFTERLNDTNADGLTDQLILTLLKRRTAQTIQASIELEVLVGGQLIVQ